MNTPLNEKICNAKHSQLLIIDVQDRLASAMPPKVLESVVKNNNTLIQAATALNIPITHSEQYPKGLGSTVTPISEQLPDTSHCITKTSFSCSNSKEFNEIIAKQKRQQIIIGGIESHICVLQTALQLQQKGYAVFIAEDAVSSRKKFNHKNAMKRLRHEGVIISNTESILFEWLRDAMHPEFKMLSKLIK